ncbi:hypothetical protein FRC17_009206 [Serendipita sp. 399]|nr:hypothetical protein FRC17_009206 [Serendipita sp. 399]
MSVKTFDVGIIFKTLDVVKPVRRIEMTFGLEGFRVATALPKSLMPLRLAPTTHWILVFAVNEECYTVELVDEEGTITYGVHHHNQDPVAYYFGTWTGTVSEIYDIARNHPMNGTTYSLTSNNCQHWAARYIHSLGDDLDADDAKLIKVINGVIRIGFYGPSNIPRANSVGPVATATVTPGVSVGKGKFIPMGFTIGF